MRLILLVKTVSGWRRLQQVYTGNARPWQSDAVASLASDVVAQRDGGAAMVLQGPQGTVIQAIGCKEDHAVAGRMVADLQQKQVKRGQVAQRPPTPPRGSHSDTLQCARRPENWSFGAVYEHRDAFGKPRLVGSTDKLPERQFLLDKNHGIPSDMNQAVVWAGVSKLPPEDMTAVRREVAHERSVRLNLDKLSSIKPYSHHGF